MPAADSRSSLPGVGSLLAAACGLGVATYLTVAHYAAPRSLACPESAEVNCEKVTTSAWSHVGVVPVSLAGAAFFATMVLLCTPAAWRRRGWDPVRVIGALSGVLVSLYLVWVELFRVGAICLWCTAAHLCSLWLLAAVLWTASGARADQLSAPR